MEHSVDGLEKQLRNVEGKLAYVVPRLEEISNPSWRPIPVFVRPPFEWPPSGMPPPDFSELATLPPIVDPAPYPPYKAPEGATPFLLDQAFHEWKEGYTAHVGLVAANQFEAARRANREVSIARRQKDEWLAAKAAERDTHNRIREAELQTEAANLNERNVLEDRHDELCRERDDLEAELTLAQDSFSRAIAARSHLLGLADEMYHVDRQRRAMGDHESLGIDIDLILEILHARNPPDGYAFDDVELFSHVEHSPLPSSPSIGSSTPVPAAPAVPASPAPAPISSARSPTKRKRSASREKSKKRRRTSSPPDFSAEEYEAAFDGQVKETLDKISEEELEVGPVSRPIFLVRYSSNPFTPSRGANSVLRATSLASTGLRGAPAKLPVFTAQSGATVATPLKALSITPALVCLLFLQNPLFTFVCPFPHSLTFPFF
jgi:hypothetical protein